MRGNSLVSVYAKAPVPGEVKTRLRPALDAQQAALLHAALTERAVETALASGLEVELCCAPDSRHAFFGQCAEDFGVLLAEQGSGDLGTRMLRTLSRGLASHGAALIVGADAPAVTAAHFKAAAKALDQADIVLVPAEDGGYVLIGARRLDPGMFDGVAWGEPTVLARQRAALERAGLSRVELETLWDVDRPADLARLASLRPPLAFQWGAP